MDLLLTASPDYKSDCFELNSDLFNLMVAMDSENPKWYNIHKLSTTTINHLSRDFELKNQLLNSPILCVLPVLTKITEWNELFFGDITKLTNSFSLAPSSQNQQLGTEIKYQNKFYLNHLIHVAKNSPLAVLELGVSSEVISLLREVTVEQKNNAMRFKLPLFQWRFSTLSLPALPPSLSLVRSSTSTAVESNTDGKLQSKTTAESGSGPRSRTKLGANSDDESVSEIDWIHYLIRSSPLALDQLPKLSALGTTYRSETVYPLAEHLVRFKMRSTIITTLIPNLHNAKMREMYHRILGTSSSCGKLPSATGWYF
ncbi:hypothetical protein QN372_19660 [Undibacterium sp. RTI2.1]|uniref:hypothetical protein n=1 Tax=unclassified Undibacterium TaxID=2630295 RepID=UPI002B233053|nr:MULTISPECIES: hypothetical protein [unclassified Undibacterium]MEB0032969.1 hypothetical protein [Undibacterium sp. RTI2.1]MEB0118728.1 hypothetical protein [Undibacterium sp. RTI2.2]